MFATHLLTPLNAHALAVCILNSILPRSCTFIAVKIYLPRWLFFTVYLSICMYLLFADFDALFHWTIYAQCCCRHFSQSRVDSNDSSCDLRCRRLNKNAQEFHERFMLCFIFISFHLFSGNEIIIWQRAFERDFGREGGMVLKFRLNT